MKTNLSEWALHHKSLVWYFMLVAMVAGTMAYFSLGREEDPAFTIKTMVVSARWPGATLDQTINQVTERIERKLEELSSLDYTKSLTTPGEVTVFVNLKDTTPPDQIRGIWVEIRNLITDIKHEFPDGVQGPAFDDHFGDVFGNIYAFTADGLTKRQLRDHVEAVRADILTIPNVGTVDVIGAEDEVIYLEFSARELAALGVDRAAVFNAIQSQNAVSPAGVFEAGPERIAVRVEGQFASETSIEDMNLRVNGRFFRLGDVAKVTRGYADPPRSLFRFGGEPAIALAIGMKANANLLEFGEALKEEMHRIVAELPIGVGVHLVSDQPEVVEEAVGGFTKALFEAVVIVLVVSFISLGLRAGLVVALSIPLVLAFTFLGMQYLDVSLQRISLGALIIALGLLVDDAMIAVEMMVARLEEGDSLKKAATYAYTSTAMPMLTGTLVTIAGFIPIGLNGSAAGEYTYTLFVVIGLALVISWVVAVVFTPLLGVTILPATLKHGHAKAPGRAATAFVGFLRLAMRRRWITIGATVALFLVSLAGMGFVQSQFFPASDRPELVVDWTLPQNSSVTETARQIERFEKTLAGDPDIVRWSSYVGQSAVRFILSFDVQPSSPYFGQTVIVTTDLEARERVRARLNALLRTEFVGIDAFVKGLELGPPVGRPVQYRVSGPDLQKVRAIAQDLAALISANPHLGEITYDWNEPARTVKVDVYQDRARQLGVSSEAIAAAINSVIGGDRITEVRDGIYLVDVVSRARGADRGSIETLQNLQLPGRDGQPVPLAAIASLRYDLEQPAVWRRGRVPTLTIKAGILDETQPATVVADLAGRVAAFAAALPASYRVATAGSVEDSARGQAPILAAVPLMLIAMATILMIQLQSFQRLFLVVAVAPLGLIGVVAALLPSGAPLGFVAILGVLALVGILIRNSVILIVQIEDLRAKGRDAWHAVAEATEHRARPILLTAAAASLGLVPIASEVFWGPMAFAMMGGIISGTLLTLFFLPALYLAWFGVKAPAERTDAEAAAYPAPPALAATTAA